MAAAVAVAAAVAAKPLSLPAAAERSAHRGMDATPCLWSPHSPGSSTSSTIPFRIECLKGSRDVAETLAPGSLTGAVQALASLDGVLWPRDDAKAFVMSKDFWCNCFLNSVRLFIQDGIGEFPPKAL